MSKFILEYRVCIEAEDEDEAKGIVIDAGESVENILGYGRVSVEEDCVEDGE